MYHQKNIIKHQLLSLYGKSLSLLLKKKLILDRFFFNTLSFLELRLSSLVLRMFFFFNLLKAMDAIKRGNVTVNNKLKHKNFLVRVGGVIKLINISKNTQVSTISTFNLVKVRGWRFKLWRK